MRFNRFIIALCAFAACGLALSTHAAPVLEEHLNAARAKHNLPALAAAVVSDSEILAFDAVGVRNIHPMAGEEADWNNLSDAARFHIGSCTKSMTATMIATLVETGAIKWETTIDEVFPELKPKIKPDYVNVTLRQLLTHTGGVVAATAGNSEESKAMRALTGSTLEQRAGMIEILLNFEPVGAPGTKSRYSNAGYGIAAAMAERVTGESWETLMRQRLFDPLKMTSTGFGWPATEDHPYEPLGHSMRDDTLISRPILDVYKLQAPIAPAGDVHCSIEDLARFAQMHLRGLRGQQTILKSETVVLLHEPAADNYACGWVKRKMVGHEAHWHNGSAGTFFAWMTIFPEKNLAIVVATNSGTGEKACAELTNALLKEFTTEESEPRMNTDEHR